MDALESPASQEDSMPIPPDQLRERQPQRVGEFLRKYGVIVVSCDNPSDDVPPSARRMASGHSNSADTIEGIISWAKKAFQDHLAYHEELGTTPCHPYIEPTSAIYCSPDGVGVVWVPVGELEGLNP